jgi:hypothetical protein
MAIQKCYIYKVYHGGTYIGNLPYVLSDFQYQQDINTPGSSINIDVGLSPDTTGAALDFLQAQDSSIFTTEAGDPFTIQRQPDIVGNDNDQIMIRSGNELKIWEYSDFWPNGKLMFSGAIERWTGAYGGNTGEDSLSIIAYPDSEDLGNYIIPGSNSLFIDQQQTTVDDFADLSEPVGISTSGLLMGRAGQTIQIGVGVTNIAAIRIGLGFALPVSSQNFKLSIYRTSNDYYNSVPPLSVAFSQPDVTGAVLITGLGVGGSFNVYDTLITLPVPISVTPGLSYFFMVQSENCLYQTGTIDTGGGFLAMADTGSYSSGDAYFSGQAGNGSSFTPFASNAPNDLYFKTYFSNLTTQRTFTSTDPASLVENILTTYGSQGGAVTYTTPSIDFTGLSVTYTFQLATVLEGIQAAAKLAPADWYWYIDAGTNVLFFKERHTTADFLLTKGVHINRLELVASTENVKNILYFSGGIDPAHPTQQIFKQYTDSASVNKYKPKIDRQSDNRVTVGATADVIGSSYLASNKNEQYQTTILIPDGVIDITLFRPGQVIGFRGFGSFVDTLLIEIVRIEYSPDSITLHLGQLPPRDSITLQQAIDDITSLQTIANPNSPS